jgi:hypothetical protein
MYWGNVFPASEQERVCRLPKRSVEFSYGLLEAPTVSITSVTENSKEYRRDTEDELGSGRKQSGQSSLHGVEICALLPVAK